MFWKITTEEKARLKETLRAMRDEMPYNMTVGQLLYLLEPGTFIPEAAMPQSPHHMVKHSVSEPLMYISYFSGNDRLYDEVMVQRTYRGWLRL